MELHVRQNNELVPISESWWYVLYPGGVSGQIVEITRIYRKKVTVRGIANTTADWTVRQDHFDDLVYGWYPMGYGLLTEDFLFAIASDDDYLLIGA